MSTYLSNTLGSGSYGMFLISATFYTIVHNFLIRTIKKSELSKALRESQREYRTDNR
jgi:hypothetical protein